MNRKHIISMLAALLTALLLVPAAVFADSDSQTITIEKEWAKQIPDQSFTPRGDRVL